MASGWTLNAYLVGDQFITDPSHGFDTDVAAGQDLAQVGDVDVDRARLPAKQTWPKSICPFSSINSRTGHNELGSTLGG
jgi:hypothetical protein